MQVEQFLNDIPAEVASRAFQGTSFTPERRAESHRRDYAETMAGDFALLQRAAEKGGTTEQLDAAFARYRSGYASHYRAWLNSQSRCISWMITGPSNFPTRRAQKWNNAAHRRLEALMTFRERALRAAVRQLRPDLRPIMAGDADAIERLAVKLAQLERLHEHMKQANAAIRRYAKDGAQAQAIALVELGFSPSRASELLRPDFAGRVGFADYELTNNGANIRRLRERLAQMERAHAQPVREAQGDGVRLEEDPPANRVRLIFETKPDAATRERLKAGGFRWAPSTGAWQAYRNPRAVALARTFVARSEGEGAPC